MKTTADTLRLAAIALAAATSIAAVVVPMSSAEAMSNRCRVMDPTGTSLNVRVTPGGRVINRLRNGRIVYVRRTAYRHGRPWVYVSGRYHGHWRNWGWVYREFVSCY
jgi:hypothetical protein